MYDYFLRAESKAHLYDLLNQSGVLSGDGSIGDLDEDGVLTEDGSMGVFDKIGTITVTDPDSDPENPTSSQLEGYHANLRTREALNDQILAILKPILIDKPNKPVRVFAE